ncbi:MAG: porin [Cyclobacteriaceae bacterium]|nr:porin [Cyclobacteriaceae bacterium]
MKNLKSVLSLVVVITVSVNAFAQETPVYASANTNDKEKKEKEAVKSEATTESVKEEETEPTFTLSGSIDTYFHSSFGYRNGGTVAPSTSFADLKGFSLGMVNLIAAYSGEKVGFVGDVVFGPRGQAAVFGTASGQAIINQAYAYYKFNDKVTLNLGQFNTFLGYEVISPAVNFHYSTSYLFSWGPFNHTGARFDYTGESGFVAKVAVMNPTDIVEFNPVNTYTLGLQLGKTSDAGGVWLNFLYGDQDGKFDEDDGSLQPGDASAGSLFQGDITLGYNVGEKFYIGLNTSYQTVAAGQSVAVGGAIEDAGGDPSSFFGVALYPKVTLSETFALGLRAEYFAIKNYHLPLFGLDNEGNGNVMEFTLSGNYKVGGLTFIPELRVDMTSENSFNKKFEAVDKKILPTLNLAAVYKF